MKQQRRAFLKMSSAAIVPAAAAALSAPILRADDGSDNALLGAWSSVHTLPFPPGSFREFLSFAEGGVLHETNSFLHTASNLDFSAFGLPNVVNASDGVGHWKRVRDNCYQAIFRKLLFDGSKENFGDLLVTGSIEVHHGALSATWHIEAVNTSGDVLSDFGPGTSEGVRIK
jgi:hypothetical protein